jgi:hypothetical protein
MPQDRSIQRYYPASCLTACSSCTRTPYRLMVHMDRGRRNFVSEASRRTAVNRPDRPFTPVTALRPGEDVPIDTNKLDIMCRYADGVIRRAELTPAMPAGIRPAAGQMSRRRPSGQSPSCKNSSTSG